MNPIFVERLNRNQRTYFIRRPCLPMNITDKKTRIIFKHNGILLIMIFRPVSVAIIGEIVFGKHSPTPDHHGVDFAPSDNFLKGFRASAQFFGCLFFGIKFHCEEEFKKWMISNRTVAFEVRVSCVDVLWLLLLFAAVAFLIDGSIVGLKMFKNKKDCCSL